jgi:response regulator RpfG family c-di-GMP phosphodiesterase
MKEGVNDMAGDDILKGKKILIVDDEVDILETLRETLDMCDIETASTYETAKELLESKTYEAVVLDIMGVRGFDLLEIAVDKKIPALMLTAHGLNPDNLVGSIKLGAKSYVPKDKMYEIDLYLKEIFTAKRKGIEKSGNWFARLSSFFDERFGHGWKNRDKKFWQEFDTTFKVSKDELEKIM